MAAGLHSILSDMFRETIVAGHVTTNPVEPARVPKARTHHRLCTIQRCPGSNRTASSAIVCTGDGFGADNRPAPR